MTPAIDKILVKLDLKEENKSMSIKTHPYLIIKRVRKIIRDVEKKVQKERPAKDFVPKAWERADIKS